MAELDANPNIFRGDVVPETNEDGDLGQPARRWKTIRAKNLIVDILTSVTSSLTVTGSVLLSFLTGSRRYLTVDTSGNVGGQSVPIPIADGGTGLSAAPASGILGSNGSTFISLADPLTVAHGGSGKATFNQGFVLAGGGTASFTSIAQADGMMWDTVGLKLGLGTTVPRQLVDVGTGDFFATQDTFKTPLLLAVSKGTNSSPDNSEGPLVGLYRTFDTNNPSGCSDGLNEHCAAALDIAVQGLSTNTVQPVGIAVTGENKTVTGTVAGTGYGDFAGIYTVGKLTVQNTTGTGKQSVGMFGAAIRTVGGGVTVRNIVRGIELTVVNNTSSDCVSAADYSNTECQGVVAYSSGDGTTAVGGMAFSATSVTAGVDQWRFGFTCAGSNRGATEACYVDASTATQSVWVRGTYTYGLNLADMTASSAGILMPAGTAANSVIAWNNGNPTFLSPAGFSPGDDNTGALGTSSNRWGNINATLYSSGANTGVDCSSGINATTFRSVGGIVTHC